MVRINIIYLYAIVVDKIYKNCTHHKLLSHWHRCSDNNALYDLKIKYI